LQVRILKGLAVELLVSAVRITKGLLRWDFGQKPAKRGLGL
jgi:hypothetical protein